MHASCGSIVARPLGHLNPRLPAYVKSPRMVPGTGPAYLGVTYKPFETNVDPANPGPFKLPNFSLPDGVTMEQLGSRRQLINSFDHLRQEIDANGQLWAMDQFHQR